MADVNHNHHRPEEDEDEETRLRREREEEIERLLLRQEEELDFGTGNGNDDDDDEQNAGNLEDPDGRNNNENNNNNNNNNENAANDAAEQLNPMAAARARQQALALEEQQQQNSNKKSWFQRLCSYRPASFLALLGLMYYAARTRRQYYLAAVYLSSSKWAYVVAGNACIAAALTVFDSTISIFLSGLRLQEAEGLQDFFRWNITETCLALTMFRSELTIMTALEFVALVTIKCLHHVATLREQHLRMTEEAVVDNTGGGGDTLSSLFCFGMMLRGTHVRLLGFLIVLQFVDLLALEYTVSNLMKDGPSVSILFAFEAAIMLVSAWSHILLWHLHCLDSILLYGHEKRSEQELEGIQQHTYFQDFCHKCLHPWKEYKATLQFAVELQGQALQFLFYSTFFAIVLTYYGMPINLFREVYMSFAALKERLTAFLKYRQLMASMNRFENVESDEALDEAGRICIICRDEMTLTDCKKLPMCHHLFHKSCLREWLVQQQSCPTCRSDIAANEVQERARRAAADAAENREEQGGGEQGAHDGGAQQEEPTDREDTERDITERTTETEHGDNEEVSEHQHENVTEQSPLPWRQQHDQQHRQVQVQVGEGFVPPAQPRRDAGTADAVRGMDHNSYNSSIFDNDSISKSVRFLEEIQIQRSGAAAEPIAVPPSKSLQNVFPALFQVVHSEGAPVYDNDYAFGTTPSQTPQQEEQKQPPTPKVLRTIPCGTLVLGQGCIAPMMRSVEVNLIKIPDGWVPEDTLSRAAVLQTHKKTTT